MLQSWKDGVSIGLEHRLWSQLGFESYPFFLISYVSMGTHSVPVVCKLVIKHCLSHRVV